MINLGKHGKLAPAEVAQKATNFFGPGRLGLTVNATGENSTRFEGGGGFVEVEAALATHGSDVVILSQEWENQA